MSRYKFFVAGTDTDVGKTFVSQALLETAKKQGLSCYGLKPVAAGCEQGEAGLRNEDALKLMGSASIKLSYQQVNPIAL
ncbi:MAG: dethiobiotin synthetase, partial [Oceanospirillaceae bacterium]